MPWKFQWFDRVDLNGDPLTGTSNTGSTYTVNLSNSPFNVIFRSFTGAAPPFNPINENVPLTPGSFLKFVNTNENEVDLTLIIKGSSRPNLYNIIAGSATNGVSLPYLFNPTKEDITITLAPPAPIDTQRLLTGNGKLRVTTPASLKSKAPIVRDLICRCISGFNLDESNLQINTAFCPLTFYANQPFWRKSTVNSFDLGTRNQTITKFPPWFTYLDNVTPGSGTAKYEKKFGILNNGDVSSPPIWTVFGPAAAPYFENRTTGKTLYFGGNCIIGEKQTLVINTERRTAQISGGSSKLNTINVKSQFWELLTNLNNVTVRLFDSGTTKVNNKTHVKVEYYERYLGVY